MRRLGLTIGGFCRLPTQEFAELGQQMKLLVEDDFVQIAEIDGVPSAMLVAFPNLHEVIHDLDGRLWPWGWLKILWRLKVSYPKTGRVALMGVRRRFQSSPMGAVDGLWNDSGCQASRLAKTY